MSTSSTPGRRSTPRALAPKTRALYAGLYDDHVSPWLGRYQLRQLTPEVIGRWQADRLAAGAPVESTRKALTLLGGILQRALEAGRIPSNPQRLVRKAAAPARTEEVATARAGHGRGDLLRPAPARRDGGASYSPTPGCARRSCGRCAGPTSASARSPCTRPRRAASAPQPRSVRLLAPLAHDLREWRLPSGRPDDARAGYPWRWRRAGAASGPSRATSSGSTTSGCRRSSGWDSRISVRMTCGTRSPRCCFTRGGR